MKFLASLLIVCIGLLSAFAGTVKPLQLEEKAHCCAKAIKNTHCTKPPEKKHEEANCEKYGCNMLQPVASAAF